ncbi:RNA polymerase sigma factor [Filimonas effusa]|uniref:RNA polymerase sigma-70 region 2 domain-containing protein n=1 Tax=Filimonas effusa TaxID=2508721 RepID=A0A4Q1D298_9BACT|nr:sigma factor [Filimonas effusa]RXK81201.1 hypothetical protein ESB13_19880 [Filimonas effusa]
MQNHQLIQLFQTRNQAGFEYLYSRYSGALYGYITRVVDDRQVAEGILKNSFVEIWKACPGFDLNRGSLFSCLLRITTQLLMAYATERGVNRHEAIQRIMRANGNIIYN